MANIVEVREMSDEKLEEKIEDAREELFNLRFQQATGQLENTARVKAVRKTVARMKTVITERNLSK